MAYKLYAMFFIYELIFVYTQLQNLPEHPYTQ